MAETEREHPGVDPRRARRDGSQGKHGGPPPVATDDMLHTALRRRANGESVEQIQPRPDHPHRQAQGQAPSVASTLALHRTNAYIQIWTKLDGYELTAHPAGPGLIALTGKDYDSGDSLATVLKPNGSKAAGFSGDPLGLTSRYDDASVTVCQTEEPRTLALDAKTGKELWSLPERGGNRVAPVAVNEYTGVALDQADHRTLIAYPATS
ncbi:hypothetical protein [Streptomyces lydicus]|uniref:hypothetical protein n=1 Tax=Streptomyces lydicus TaxID=47763 RepID=UPI00343E2029